MTSWSNWGKTAESKAGRFLKELEAQDVYDQSTRCATTSAT
jgi:hypothetical protein